MIAFRFYLRIFAEQYSSMLVKFNLVKFYLVKFYFSGEISFGEILFGVLGNDFMIVAFVPKMYVITKHMPS